MYHNIILKLVTYFNRSVMRAINFLWTHTVSVCIENICEFYIFFYVSSQNETENLISQKCYAICQ